MSRGMRRVPGVVLLVCWAVSATGEPTDPPRRKCEADMLCSARLVIDVAAGTLAELQATANGLAWVKPGTLIDTPRNGQVFKIAENRITAMSNDNTREYISFHVLYDDKGGSGNVKFEYGAKIDRTGSWCSALPIHPLFAGQSCAPGAVKRTNKMGGLSAYLVTVSTDLTTADSGEMRDSKSRVCFSATDIDLAANPPRNMTGATRCVYLRAITRTQFPKIFMGGSEVPSTDAMVAFVGNSEDLSITEQGYDLRLEVRAVSLAANLKVDIEPSTFGGRVFAELPGQRWAGPTTCLATGSTHGPCEVWTRTLIYRPTAVQIQKEFKINFQTITRFPQNNLFSDPQYAGVACAGVIGPCRNDTDVVNFMLNADGARVRVVEWTPRFRFTKEDHHFVMDEVDGGTFMGQIMQRQVGVPLTLPVYASAVMKCTDPKAEDEESPATCIRDPHPAYANCPMKPFSFVAEMACMNGVAARQFTLPSECNSASISTATAGLQFVIASARSASGSNAVSMGLRLSERLFIAQPITEIGQDNSPVGGAGVKLQYLAHVAVVWTPPLEAMGHVFNVCVDAKGPKGFVKRCVPVEVKRCFYCTVQSETLHTIAAKFQTEWMQLWSANHEKMDEVRVLRLSFYTTILVM